MKTSSSESEFQVVVPGDPRSLALVRSFVGHLALTAGFDDVEASKIEVAVDEACANIIEHAYSEMERKPPVTVQVVLSDDSFVVQIFDEGKSFDKAFMEAPSIWSRIHAAVWSTQRKCWFARPCHLALISATFANMLSFMRLVLSARMIVAIACAFAAANRMAFSSICTRSEAAPPSLLSAPPSTGGNKSARFDGSRRCWSFLLRK